MRDRLRHGGNGVNIEVVADAHGLPVVVPAGRARPHESNLAQGLFEIVLRADAPERIIGDSACEHDWLDIDLVTGGSRCYRRTARALRRGT